MFILINPIQINKIPEIIDQIKSVILLDLFIWFPIKIPKFKKINWKIPTKIGKNIELTLIKLKLKPIPKLSIDKAIPRKKASFGSIRLELLKS